MPDMLMINPIGKLQLEYEISQKENKQPNKRFKTVYKITWKIKSLIVIRTDFKAVDH